MTVLRVESVTVTGTDVTENEDIVTVTREETERDERLAERLLFVLFLLFSKKRYHFCLTALLLYAQATSSTGLLPD